jgi:ribonucleoside-diphosphate reductase alpha chain
MRLGYTGDEVAQIVDYIDSNSKIEGAPHLKPEHLFVFDCSLAPSGGGRSIAWRGHLRMMAAAQPFLSGAISKTINMPEESTVEDIMEAYIESWKLGLKAVAIYRDNSKRSQPLSAALSKKDAAAAQSVSGSASSAAEEPERHQRELFPESNRRKLPAERPAITHKFSVAGHEGYITTGMYEDGNPGEIFIKMAKEGSTLSGFMDGIAISISIGLQYGVPLKAYVDKLMNTTFEPLGFTDNQDIRIVSSVLDYIARYLGGRFISTSYLKIHGAPGESPVSDGPAPLSAIATANSTPSTRMVDPTQGRPIMASGPLCSECGTPMVPNGSCYKCENCGGTSGCS